MKKTLFAIATLALLTVFTSAHTTKPADGRVGYNAPNFTVSNSDTTMSLQELKGNYVLLTFWSSDDAESRIANMHYEREANGQSNLRHLSVNFDQSEGVFNEIVDADGLDKMAQFHVAEGDASKLVKGYNIDKGYNTFLVSPAGEILAINPDDNTIKTTLNS